jgi:hypothetical protein
MKGWLVALMIGPGFVIGLTALIRLGSGREVAAILSLYVAAEILAAMTTDYKIKSDRLVIQRLGFVWMEILFADVEEIETGFAFLQRFRQIGLYQLNIRTPFAAFRNGVRITRRKGVRYVLINPDDPELIVQAFRKYQASHWSEPPILSNRPLPDFLRPPS